MHLLSILNLLLLFWKLPIALVVQLGRQINRQTDRLRDSKADEGTATQRRTDR